MCACIGQIRGGWEWRLCSIIFTVDTYGDRKKLYVATERAAKPTLSWDAQLQVF